MFKSRFIKPSSVQPFKPCLMNVALEYIRKKKKKNLRMDLKSRF